MERTVNTTGGGPSRRKAWMETLAKAPEGSLASFWRGYAPKPPYRVLRGPEVGLVMVQGRTGGTGRPFKPGRDGR